jgi:DNA-binding transcriptional regulator YiaG
MVKATKSKSPGRRKAKRAAKSDVDPRQMGLFDALEPAPAAAASQPRVRAQKMKHPRADAIERPVVLSPREAAQYLGVSVSTLKNWRAKLMGPKWAMRGARLVGYRPADLEKFLDDNSARR